MGLEPKEITVCAGCDGELVGNAESGKTLCFYRVEFSQFIPDFASLQERGGLTAIFASGGGPPNVAAALADVFAPTATVATRVENEPDVMNICFKCYVERPLAEIMERQRKD